jgi:hypothetical protein
MVEKAVHVKQGDLCGGREVVRAPGRDEQRATQESERP